MHISKRINTFTVQHPLIGPLVWMLCVHYFITQLIVANAWDTPYSLSHNAISDLGNTVCGPYADRYVCSPLHGLMNTSFIVLGIFMGFGSALIYNGFKKSKASYIGFSLMAIAGFGTVLVGLFPENTIHELHSFGALLAFLLGNLSLVVLGSFLDMPKYMRYYTLLSGFIGLLGLILYGLKSYLGLGEGGMERLAAYPQSIWLIVFGVYISAHRYRIYRLRHKKQGLTKRSTKTGHQNH
jgi:hypothetical membrane protein